MDHDTSHLASLCDITNWVISYMSTPRSSSDSLSHIMVRTVSLILYLSHLTVVSVSKLYPAWAPSCHLTSIRQVADRMDRQVLDGLLYQEYCVVHGVHRGALQVATWMAEQASARPRIVETVIFITTRRNQIVTRAKCTFSH